MPTEETCTHGETPNTCVECTTIAALTDTVARRAFLENRDARVRADALNSGWLIETIGPRFYGRYGWGTADAAIRFMRRVDAEVAIARFALRSTADGAEVYATDHLWVPRPE